MLLWTRAEAARLTSLRASQGGGAPGPEGSIAKLQMAELNQAVYELCVDLLGPEGLLIDTYERFAPTGTALDGGRDVRKSWLRSLANSIEGGASEVQRAVLGERVLGLPGEPRSTRMCPGGTCGGRDRRRGRGEQGHVVAITLDPAERRNAVTTAMYAQLADEFGKADAAAEAEKREERRVNVGLMSLGDQVTDPVTGTRQSAAERHRAIVEAAAVADEVGFGGVYIGEHHGLEYTTSAPPVVLARSGSGRGASRCPPP